MTLTTPVVDIRRSEDRFHTKMRWLDSRHSFSFGHHYDPQNTHFGLLLVSNDDVVKAGTGFDTHPHRDMEIVTWVLEGELEHKDSLGTGSVLVPGDVQRMTAGTGVLHSEFNPSPTEAVHLYQIWLMPDRAGHVPSYEQKAYAQAEKDGKLRIVASPDGRDGSVTILSLPGHTVGSLGLRVKLPDRTIIFSGDSAHQHGNIDMNAGMPYDVSSADKKRSLRKLNLLRTQPGTTVWCNHDPDDWAKNRPNGRQVF